MHQRGRFEERATGITRTEGAGSDDGAQAGQANLAAVRVARQHQVKVVLASPHNLIG